jgi:hypothetical protein
MKLVSEAKLRGNWCRTLVGEELELEDRSASARGPPIEAIWLEPHPIGQFNCGCSRSWPGSTPLPVDNFSDTSDDVFPRIEMEREVAEFIKLALLLPLSGSWSCPGQSSKKGRKIWLSDWAPPETSLRGSKKLMFSGLDSEELQEAAGSKSYEMSLETYWQSLRYCWGLC